MPVLPTINAFVKEQNILLENNLNQVAINIVDYIRAINSSDSAIGEVWGSSELDKLAVNVGRRVFDTIDNDNEIINKTRTYVYIATELHKTGGHTPALFKVTECRRDYKHVVFITDILGEFDEETFREYVSTHTSNVAEFIVVPEMALNEKIKWLQTKLNNIAPEALFLFNHHEDVVAVACSINNICEDIYYYHHADHHLALGVFLDHAVHIDPHNIGFSNCRNHLKKIDNIYWPLTIDDRGCRDSKKIFLFDGVLNTCTCAGANKIEINYSYQYKDIVVGRLKHSTGMHFHVGWLTDDFLEQIRADLRENDIDENRFIYTQWVDSIWLFLLEANIDLYISSFPLGGGSTTIECMGSGTPILMHNTYKTKFHSGIDIAYRGVMSWRLPGELYEILEKLNSEILLKHSRMGREYYLKHYRPEKLLEVLSDAQTMKQGITPPSLSLPGSDIDSVVKKINSIESEENNFALKLNAIQKKYDEANVMRDVAIDERDMAVKMLDIVTSERDKIYNSKSWKITKPLRYIYGKLMRVDADV